MTNQEIFDLMDRFEHSSLSSMKLSTGAYTLELEKGAAASVPAAAPAAPAASTPAADSHVVKAPLVGVFYAAPAPDAAPFVTVGDRVSKGQPLCLMEAMKMLSEVTAPCDCVITEILKENGALAAFAEPLFRYQPC